MVGWSLRSGAVTVMTAEPGAVADTSAQTAAPVDIDAAHGLYGGMGFTDHHAYHYRVAPAAP